jgi:hypothetical protein
MLTRAVVIMVDIRLFSGRELVASLFAGADFQV